MSTLPNLSANYNTEEVLILNICDAIETYVNYLKDNKATLISQFNSELDSTSYDLVSEVISEYFMSDDLFNFGEFEEDEFEERFSIKEEEAVKIIENFLPFSYIFNFEKFMGGEIPIKGNLFSTCQELISAKDDTEFLETSYEYGFDDEQVDRYLEFFEKKAGF